MQRHFISENKLFCAFFKEQDKLEPSKSVPKQTFFPAFDYRVDLTDWQKPRPFYGHNFCEPNTTTTDAVTRNINNNNNNNNSISNNSSRVPVQKSEGLNVKKVVFGGGEERKIGGRCSRWPTRYNEGKTSAQRRDTGCILTIVFFLKML